MARQKPAARQPPRPPRESRTAGPGSNWLALLWVLFGVLAVSVHLQSVLSRQDSATTLLSPATWQHVVRALGGSLISPAGAAGEAALADVPFGPLLLVVGTCAVLALAVSAVLVRLRTGLAIWAALPPQSRNFCWWLLPGVWEVLQIVAFLVGWEGLTAFIQSTPPYVYAVMLGGWLAGSGVFPLSDFAHWQSEDVEAAGDSAKVHDQRLWLVTGMALCWAVVFTAMNWQLYRSLRVPHGDSAMYEEHLWNLLHGKGFRSYLDQGLFLGEHIQVIHLALIPLYVLWPSHLLLELCESLALASGAVAVYLLARRHEISPRNTGSARANHRGSQTGLLLAAAYLLYFPLQFLDIAIDLKTFRPISFGVPLLLFALDQFERRRLKTMLVLLVLTLLAKEDFAIILAPLGLWMALTAWRESRPPQTVEGTTAESPATEQQWRKVCLIAGAALAAGAAIYLVLATRVLIPWFRDGAEVHYARYFSRFGDGLGEIAWNMLTRPGLLAEALFNLSTAHYLLALLVPVAGVALFSPGRLAVAAPLTVILCLNEIATDPRHHFHAPLVPIVFWATAAGVPLAVRKLLGLRRPATGTAAAPVELTVLRNMQVHVASLVCGTALCSGLFFSISPLGIPFLDPGSAWNWRKLYVPDRRAELFPRVLEQIPLSARVASTDFVHPRFTHHERSYDYSNYARRVSGYELTVPDDTDYIVIDTRHRYSTIKRPEDVPEYRDHPDRWELLPDRTEGCFIVLRRRNRP